jgi:mannose-6-phosphate isomerase-like protein (cupin superfamily)
VSLHWHLSRRSPASVGGVEPTPEGMLRRGRCAFVTIELNSSQKGDIFMQTSNVDSAASGSAPVTVRILAASDGEIMGPPGTVRDRFMIHSDESGGGFALVEHHMPPRTLAAPLHRHAHEDEYSYVLEGKVGAMLGDQEVYAEVGDLIFKPRNQWHTFWNAGDAPARVLEIISPGGFEKCFLEMHALGEALNPEAMAEIGERFGAEVDFQGTEPLIERLGLSF